MLTFPDGFQDEMILKKIDSLLQPLTLELHAP